MRFSTILAPIALAASALAQSFSIATPPSLVQCQPVSLSWTGGSAPFTLAVIPGGQTTAAAIAFIASNVNSSPYTWTVNLQTGQSVTLKITDAQGNNAYSSQLTIQQGASSSCLTASSGSSSMSGASASASSSSMMASSTSRSASATSSSMAMSSSAAASSSATASTSNAASSVSGQVSSALASVTSTSRSGAFATAVAGLPAVAAGALGAVAVLF